MLPELNRVVSSYLDSFIYERNRAFGHTTITELHNRRRNGKYVDIINRHVKIYNYKNGCRHGLYQHFNAGILVKQYNYCNNIPIGNFTVIDGGCTFIGAYVDGNFHGEVKIYHNGKLIKILNYEKGIIKGPNTLYHDNGVVKQKGNYELGRLHGLCYTYDLKGRLEETAYYDYGQKHGEETQFYKNGAIKCKTDYKYDRMDGSWSHYSKNGDLLQTATYIMNCLSGPNIHYRKNGSIISYRILNANRELKSITYYKNGKVKSVKSFNYETVYNQDGSIKCEGSILDEGRIGMWLFYNSSDGRVMEKIYD